MVPDSFDQDVKTFLQAIVLCLQNKLGTPALALIFTVIDTMAWFGLDESHDEVHAADFEKWTREYLLPGSGLKCTAGDLYAARCAVLHTHTAESRKSRQGAAREIYYAWGDRKEGELQRAIERGSRDACAVHVQKLHRALPEAIDRFVADLNKDPERFALALQRADKLVIRVDVPRRNAK